MKTLLTTTAALVLLLLAMRPSDNPDTPAPTPAGPPPAARGHGRNEEDSGPRSVRAAQPVSPGRATLETALDRIEAESDDVRRGEMLDEAAAAPVDSELPAMIDSAASDPRPCASELTSLLLHRWASVAPEESAAWAARLPAGAMRLSAFKMVAVTWAESDPGGVTKWVRALPAGADRDGAALSLGYEVARTNPLLALDCATLLEPGREQDDLLLHAVSQWADCDPVSATSWSARVSDLALRQELLAAVAVAGATQDGAAAATLAMQELQGTDDKDHTVIAVVQRWAQASPSAAAAWVLGIQEPGLRGEAARSLIQLWATQDSDASGAWARELPDGSLREISLAAHGEATVTRGTTEVTATTPPGIENSSP